MEGTPPAQCAYNVYIKKLLPFLLQITKIQNNAIKTNLNLQQRGRGGVV